MNLTIDSNVQNIIFNGNDVQKLVYNGVEVWSKGASDEYLTQYFTVEITGFVSSSSSYRFYLMDNSSSYRETWQYSKDDGANWYNITSNNSYGIGISNYVSLTNTIGQKILFKRTSNTAINGHVWLWGNQCKYKIYGNIMSLIYGDNFIGQTTIPVSYFFNYFISASNSSTYNNKSLVTNVENLRLPATTLTEYCYQSMFAECSLIEKAPILPADEMYSNCYDTMFANCSKLNYVKCLGTKIKTTWGGIITSNLNFNYWLTGVKSSGTFVCPNATAWQSGVSGIPTGWTTENI